MECKKTFLELWHDEFVKEINDIRDDIKVVTVMLWTALC
jgi:hypothetical protein